MEDDDLKYEVVQEIPERKRMLTEYEIRVLEFLESMEINEIRCLKTGANKSKRDAIAYRFNQIVKNNIKNKIFRITKRPLEKHYALFIRRNE